MEILRRDIIGFFFFLFCIGTTVSQHQSVDIIYSNLDAFLERPSPENLAKLQNLIDTISTADKEVQLAKTIAYCNIGYVETQNGALQKAIDVYEKAKQLYFSENLSDYDIIEYCLKPLGNLYIKSQALSEAENTIKHYILYAKESGQTNQEISGILNLSVLYHNRGEFEKAKNILLQTLKKEPSNLDLKLNLASAYFALNQKDKTKKLLKDILDITSQNVYAYQLLAQVQLSEKERDKAILNLKKALNLLRNNPETKAREMAKMHLSLAETYLAADQLVNSFSEIQKIYAQLIPSYKKEQSLPTKEQLYAESTLMDVLDLHANSLSQQGKPEEALKVFDLASGVNDFLFAQLYIQDSKLIAQQNVKRRSELMMELFYQQYQKTKNIEWLNKAIQLDSKIKGRIVTESVFLKEKLNSNNSKKSTEFRHLQKELATLGDQIQKQIKNNNLDYNELVSLQKEYSAALTKQRIVYDSIQSEIADVSQTKTLIDLDEIKNKAAASNQTLVSYFIGSETVFQFIISKEKAVFKKLVNSQVEYEQFSEAIRSYNHFFNDPTTINNDIPLFAAASLKLHNQLELPKAENLIIIPDGILSFIPFQTLLTKETKTFQYNEMPFLVFKSSISYVVSFSGYIKTAISFKESQSVLGVFPVFKNTPQELGYSVFEAKAIANIFTAVLLMESQASASNFIENADSHSILHLSTHALGGTFSSEPTIQFYDRTFSVEELYGLHFSSQLVVLSACDTGIGKVVIGEGALSLARGFQYAGAPNVLFSLWQVNDKSTAQLMGYYYQNLKKTQSRNLSLYQASLNYLQDETIDNPRKSPYYWGAFVYYGTTDAPQQNGELRWVFLLLAIIPLSGIAVWYFKKRRT